MEENLSNQPFSPLLGEAIEMMEEVLLASPESKNIEPCRGTSPAGAGGSNDSAPRTEEALKRPIKLCGAARKRFRRLLAANVRADEARALALKPWSAIPLEGVPPDPKAKKRPRSEDESPKEQAKKTPRIVTPVNQPSFKQVVEQTRVGIKNQSPMCEDQMKLVHRALTLAMLNITEKGKGPKFSGFIHRPGWILVTCDDQASLKWLTEKIPGIKPWDGASLSVIPGSELPKPLIGTTFIPSSEAESLDEATRLLGIQNEGLNTELWRVAHSRAEGNGHVVSFFLDQPSVAAIRAMKSEVTLGFKRLTFKIKSDPEVVPSSVAPEATVEPQPSTSSGSEKLGGDDPRSRPTVPQVPLNPVPRSCERPVSPQPGPSTRRVGSERLSDVRYKVPAKSVPRSKAQPKVGVGVSQGGNGSAWQTVSKRGRQRPKLTRSKPKGNS